MNLIAANLLYHAEDYIAFWLMAMIFEDCDMRKVFLPCKIFFLCLSKK